MPDARIIAAIIAPLLMLAASLPAAGQTPVPTDKDTESLKTLRLDHPRLIAFEEDFARVRDMARGDADGQRWMRQLRKEAEDLLDKPPAEHKLVGPRLLGQSRLVLARVYVLALAYRIEGDERFAERARKEMLTAAAFPDWNPSHFLDTAEMTHALAIGYDWLYDYLSTADRAKIIRAIVDLGLKASLPTYQKQNWWATASHNWNQVCNGGMIMGALAVADKHPDIAAYVIGRAVESVPRAMATYAPDGAWPEGPGYWHYATRYTVTLMAGLTSALGTDFGLSEAPGFDKTGLFELCIYGPTGRSFNFADGGDGQSRVPCLFWLARRFDEPVLAWEERRRADAALTPLDFIWFDRRGKGPKAERVPLDVLFKGIGVAVFRGAWEDPDTVFAGFRGGDNKVNHSHLDLGTFVLDALGKRWAVDLGAEEYNLPGYWDRKGPRWEYYRLSTHGHNTITLNGKNQLATAAAPITSFVSRPELAFAVADMTAGYPDIAKSLERGLAMVDRRQVLVQDEIECREPAEALWTMHTDAAIEIRHAHKAVLRIGDLALTARILEPAAARFEQASAEQAAPQKPNKGVSRLHVRLPDKTASTRIAVLFTPGDGDTKAPDVRPLAEWR